MANDLNVVYRISADIAGLKDGVAKAQQSTAGLEKSATSLGNAFDTSFSKIGTSAQRGIGTVTAELLLAQKEVKNLQTLVLKNADKPGFVAALGYELDVAIPKVNALERELKGLQTGMQGTNNQGTDLLGWLGKGNNLLATFGVGLSVGAVVSFGKSLLDDADALVKMSDKTGISIEGLQRLQVAGDDAGNTIEQMTSAVNQMQNRLVNGNDSAVSALRTLGLSFDDIKNLNPENQFVAISDAIRQVKDPADQVAIAMALFGKTGAEVLPTLKRGFDDVKGAAVGMSAETAHALDDLGDMAAAAWRKVKGGAAEATVGLIHFIQDGADPSAHAVGNITREAAQAEKQLRAMIAAMPSGVKPSAFPAPLVVPTSASPEFQKGLKDQEAAERTLKETADKAAEAHARLVEKLYDVERQGYKDSIAFSVMASDLTKLGQRDDSVLDLKKAFDEVTKSVAAALSKIHEVTSLRWPSDLQDMLKNLGVAGQGIIPSTITVPPGGGVLPVSVPSNINAVQIQARAAKASLNDLAAAFAQLAQVSGTSMGPAVQDVGKFLNAINLANTASKALQTVTDELGTHIVASFSQSATAALSFVSAALVVKDVLLEIIPTAGDAFGLKQVQNLQNLSQFVKSLGLSAEEFAAKVEKAGLSLQKLFADRKNMSAFRADLEAIKKAFDDLDKAAQHTADLLREASSKFGPSQHDKEEAVKHSREILDAMIVDGTFTKDQLFAAYTQWQIDMANAGDKAAEEWVRNEAEKGNAAAKAWAQAASAATDAQKKAMTDAEKELTGLIDKRNSLAEGIAKEAPEAVMGVIETQQRGELKALDGEIQRKADDYAKLAKETGQEMAQAIIDALSKIHIDPLHIGVILDGPGGSGIVAGGPDPGSFTPGGRPETSRFSGLDYNAYLRDYWAPDRNYVLSQIPHAARGGMVRDWGIEHFATGGIVGRDSVPTMLTPGEMVLTHDQQGWVGAMLGGNDQPIILHNRTYLDGQLVAENTVQRFARDKRGVGTKARRALGVGN